LMLLSLRSVEAKIRPSRETAIAVTLPICLKDLISRQVATFHSLTFLSPPPCDALLAMTLPSDENANSAKMYSCTSLSLRSWRPVATSQVWKLQSSPETNIRPSGENASDETNESPARGTDIFRSNRPVAASHNLMVLSSRSPPAATMRPSGEIAT